MRLGIHPAFNDRLRRAVACRDVLSCGGVVNICLPQRREAAAAIGAGVRVGFRKLLGAGLCNVGQLVGGREFAQTVGGALLVYQSYLLVGVTAGFVRRVVLLVIIRSGSPGSYSNYL